MTFRSGGRGRPPDSRRDGGATLGPRQFQRHDPLEIQGNWYLVSFVQDAASTYEAPANNRPSNCRYVDPPSAAVDVTFKFGPAVEAGNLSVGMNMFTKTLGEEGVGSR